MAHHTQNERKKIPPSEKERVGHSRSRLLVEIARVYRVSTTYVSGARFGFAEQRQHLAIEGRDVRRLAAAHPISVAHHFLVHPLGPGIAQVVLNGVITRQRAAFGEPGRDQQPRRVADKRNRLLAPDPFPVRISAPPAPPAARRRSARLRAAAPHRNRQDSHYPAWYPRQPLCDFSSCFMP